VNIPLAVVIGAISSASVSTVALFGLYRHRRDDFAAILAELIKRIDVAMKPPVRLAPTVKRRLFKGWSVEIRLGTSSRAATRSRAARGLAKMAACLPPASERDRYAEEFSAELYYLAQSGAGRLRQLLYSLRQIRKVLQVRSALRSPRRESATP
jgi:hypothetical protein